jgi:hypothetical protein
MVAIDGSEHSLKAAQYALDIAKWSGTKNEDWMRNESTNFLNSLQLDYASFISFV